MGWINWVDNTLINSDTIKIGWTVFSSQSSDLHHNGNKMDPAHSPLFTHPLSYSDWLSVDTSSTCARRWQMAFINYIT